MSFGAEMNTPIAPVNSPRNIGRDPQFRARFEVLPHERHGADMLGYPRERIESLRACGAVG